MTTNRNVKIKVSSYYAAEVYKYSISDGSGFNQDVYSSQTALIFPINSGGSGSGRWLSILRAAVSFAIRTKLFSPSFCQLEKLSYEKLIGFQLPSFM